MILTGQAKKDFEKWYSSTESVDIYKSDYSDDVFRIMQNALIVHWFGTVGVYVNAISYYDHWRFIVRFQYDKKHKTQLKAIEAGIIEANNLYNEYIKK